MKSISQTLNESVYKFDSSCIENEIVEFFIKNSLKEFKQIDIVFDCSGLMKPNLDQYVRTIKNSNSEFNLPQKIRTFASTFNGIKELNLNQITSSLCDGPTRDFKEVLKDLEMLIHADTKSSIVVYITDNEEYLNNSTAKEISNWGATWILSNGSIDGPIY